MREGRGYRELPDSPTFWKYYLLAFYLIPPVTITLLVLGF